MLTFPFTMSKEITSVRSSNRKFRTSRKHTCALWPLYESTDDLQAIDQGEISLNLLRCAISHALNSLSSFERIAGELPRSAFLDFPDVLSTWSVTCARYLSPHKRLKNEEKSSAWEYSNHSVINYLRKVQYVSWHL